jgi:hypothetical protein
VLALLDVRIQARDLDQKRGGRKLDSVVGAGCSCASSDILVKKLPYCFEYFIFLE